MVYSSHMFCVHFACKYWVILGGVLQQTLDRALSGIQSHSEHGKAPRERMVAMEFAITWHWLFLIDSGCDVNLWMDGLRLHTSQHTTVRSIIVVVFTTSHVR